MGERAGHATQMGVSRQPPTSPKCAPSGKLSTSTVTVKLRATERDSHWKHNLTLIQAVQNACTSIL